MDARILMELDQLYKLNNYCNWHRLQLLEDHIDLVEQQDDLYLERIILYNQLGILKQPVPYLLNTNFIHGKVVKGRL